MENLQQTIFVITFCLIGICIWEVIRPRHKSKFLHLENVDAEKLMLEIASMSLEQKEEMLDDLIEYGKINEENYRVAIVILQYMVEELKPNVRL